MWVHQQIIFETKNLIFEFIQIQLFEGNGGNGILRVKEKKNTFWLFWKWGEEAAEASWRWMAVIASSIFLLQSGNMGRKMVPSVASFFWGYFQEGGNYFFFLWCQIIFPALVERIGDVPLRHWLHDHLEKCVCVVSKPVHVGFQGKKRENLIKAFPCSTHTTLFQPDKTHTFYLMAFNSIV